MILHKCPLQRISFAADDKEVKIFIRLVSRLLLKDKRVFSFIARAENDPSRHDCFIFLSDKMAEQITLTIGEAFDLAYKVSQKFPY